MDTDDAGGRYRSWYERLLRLYPRSFREHFGEGMAQTFHDLCRERSNANRRLLGFALWTFVETLVGIIRENTTQMSQWSKTILGVALGALAALMAPLVASRLVEGWHWNAGSFVFVYVLFFAVGMAFALIARTMKVWSYKVGVGLSLLMGFGLAWSTMVHVADSGHPEGFVYYAVIVEGIVGASLARLRARGLAYTLFAMAATYALIAVILPSGAPPDLARDMAIGHGVAVVLLTTSGLLFRHASLAEVK